MCDDECPECGKNYSPADSVWTGPSDRVLRGLWEGLPDIAKDAEYPVSITVQVDEDGVVRLGEGWTVIGIDAPEVVTAAPWPDFDAAMRRLVHDLDPRAVVFEVDAGLPDSRNIKMTAGVIVGGAILRGTEVTRSVAREWLREFTVIWRERNIPNPDDAACPSSTM